MQSAPKNIAYIDGQNLHLATTTRTNDSWRVDFVRFRRFLAERYQAKEAYCFLGYTVNENEKLYDAIQRAGFILKFREHSSAMLSAKKGNVDIEIVFDIMKKLYQKYEFEKVVLVSGDGDYFRLVRFLIEEGKFKKILFPDSATASSLYKQLGSEHFAGLDNPDTRRKIAQKEKGSLGS